MLGLDLFMCDVSCIFSDTLLTKNKNLEKKKNLKKEHVDDIVLVITGSLGNISGVSVGIRDLHNEWVSNRQID